MVFTRLFEGIQVYPHDCSSIVARVAVLSLYSIVKWFIVRVILIMPCKDIVYTPL